MRARVGIAVGLVVAAAAARVGLDSYDWLEEVWGGKADDLAYWGVAASPLVLGAVAMRWWTVGFVGAVYAVSVLVDRALWDDDPRLEGMDDLDPLLGIVLVPLPMALAAVGVGLGRVVRAARRRGGLTPAATGPRSPS